MSLVIVSLPATAPSDDAENRYLSLLFFTNTLRSQLNWSQYRRLIQIEDADKREYYVLEGLSLCVLNFKVVEFDHFRMQANLPSS